VKRNSIWDDIAASINEFFDTLFPGSKAQPASPRRLNHAPAGRSPATKVEVKPQELRPSLGRVLRPVLSFGTEVIILPAVEQLIWRRELSEEAIRQWVEPLLLAHCHRGGGNIAATFAVGEHKLHIVGFGKPPRPDGGPIWALLAFLDADKKLMRPRLQWDIERLFVEEAPEAQSVERGDAKEAAERSAPSDTKPVNPLPGATQLRRDYANWRNSPSRRQDGR